MVGHPPSSTEVVNLNSMQSAKATDTHQRTVFLCPGIIDNSASTNLFSNVQSRTRVSRENWWLPASGSLRGHHRLRGSSIHTDNTICHFWDKHGFVEAQPRHMTSTLWKKKQHAGDVPPNDPWGSQSIPKKKSCRRSEAGIPGPLGEHPSPSHPLSHSPKRLGDIQSTTTACCSHQPVADSFGTHDG